MIDEHHRHAAGTLQNAAFILLLRPAETILDFLPFSPPPVLSCPRCLYIQLIPLCLYSPLLCWSTSASSVRNHTLHHCSFFKLPMTFNVTKVLQSSRHEQHRNYALWEISSPLSHSVITKCWLHLG